MNEVSESEIDPNAPAFWTEKPDRVTRIKWQEAIVDYLTAHRKEQEQVEFGIDLVKDCLPYLKTHDDRWRGIQKDEFNMALYTAHY